MESLVHPANVFATLTYREEMYELCPEHLQMFIRRLRKRLMPRRVRYFGVGEYGEGRGRPHYHVALFGVSVSEYRDIERAWSVRVRKKDVPLGFTHCGELNEQSAAYLAGYVTKKMTSKEDPRLCGKHPEFARMSLRPGIGHGACLNFADGLMTGGGAKAVMAKGDVPSDIRVGKTRYPLGRYLRRELRKGIGWSGETPELVLLKARLEAQLMTPAEKVQRERRRWVAEQNAKARTAISNSKRKL